MKRKLIRVFWVLLILGSLAIALAWWLIPDFGLMVGRRYRMYFVGNEYPVTYLQATPVGDSIFLSWNIPDDSRFDHVEIYYSTDYVPDRNNSEKQPVLLETPSPNSTYMWYKPEAGTNANAYFTIYTVDGNGDVSEGVTDRILRANAPGTTTKHPRAKPAGVFTYYYEFRDVFFQLPYYILENEYLKCWFANGTLFAIESKNSDLKPEYNPFGPFHSFTNSMDTWEVVAPEVGYPIFSLPADMYPGSSDSTWLETGMDSTSIWFIRSREGEGDIAQLAYTLDSTQLKVELLKRNNSKYNIRFNTFGDENFKAITHWEAKNIRGSIEEDGKEEEQIAAAESHAPDQSYEHIDKVFNDDYPYKNSRAFVLMGPESEFHLYHMKQKLFVLRDIRGNEDFLYKNCSGEENFSFGMRWPYEKHVTTINQQFSFVIDVKY